MSLLLGIDDPIVSSIDSVDRLVTNHEIQYVSPVSRELAETLSNTLARPKREVFALVDSVTAQHDATPVVSTDGLNPK
jgi:hypothetical protein